MFRSCDRHQGAALFLAKITLLKIFTDWFPYNNLVFGSMSYFVGRASLIVQLAVCVVCFAAIVSSSITHDAHSQLHS